MTMIALMAWKEDFLRMVSTAYLLNRITAKQVSNQLAHPKRELRAEMQIRIFFPTAQQTSVKT